jgi:hypothetical protein
MQTRSRAIFGRIAVCLITLGVLGARVTDVYATILVFDQKRELGVVLPTGTGGDVPQDYGDRVAGAVQAVSGGNFTYGEAGEAFTPNIVVEYVSIAGGAGVSDVNVWGESYGDLINIAFGNQFSNTLEVRLTADPGFRAVLHGFDLAGWPNADYTIDAVRVLDGVTVLFSQANVLVEGDLSGPRHTSFTFANALSGGDLLIEIDYSNLPAAQQDNIGIDNIRFGQDPPAAVIPEPSTMLLLVVGLFALPVLMRRARVGVGGHARRGD